MPKVTEETDFRQDVFLAGRCAATDPFHGHVHWRGTRCNLKVTCFEDKASVLFRP